MILFLDSSAIIEFFKNNESAISIIAEAGEVYTSTICAYEVILGEFYKKKKGMNSSLEKVQKFFETIVTVPFTYEDSIRASEITAHLSSKGKKLNDFDVLIASQALPLGATVLTTDVKHFEIIKAETALPIKVL
jgi:tRNA(fMet)-specific endonuclease VapC